jgi:hypothetical protein
MVNYFDKTYRMVEKIHDRRWHFGNCRIYFHKQYNALILDIYRLCRIFNNICLQYPL